MVNRMKADKRNREVHRTLAGLCAAAVVALGAAAADLFWVPRHSPLFYGLLALGALALGVLMYLFAVNLIYPLMMLSRLTRCAQEERPDLQRLLESTPRRGLYTGDILRLVSLAYAQGDKERMLEALKKEAELNSLRSQINPHFLYNTLDSIRGQLMTLGAYDASDIIESLSNLFRYSINPRTVYNTLEQELDNVRDYMRIMHFRLGDRLVFATIIDTDNPSILNCEMPKLTLQPIVENAIQHGLEHIAGNGRITLRAFAAQDGLNILVTDNGCGIDPKRLDELNSRFREGSPVEKGQGAGLALVNVNERIRMLYGAKPYGLHVSSEVGLGTQVHILLPMRLMPAEPSPDRAGRVPSP